VPGDGNCLFHSISLCLCHAVNGTHWSLSTARRDVEQSLQDLYRHSQHLRRQAVACLSQKRGRLFLQGRESLRASELVEAAAQQYGLTAQEYCAAMRQDSVWGGGPEIVALCNLLQRPIHVYELATDEEEEGAAAGREPAFVLRRMACFGSPRFDRRSPLHILSADSRFPDVRPGNQLAAGNHFLAVFPIEEVHRKRKRIRGGCTRDRETSLDRGETPAEERFERPWFRWWWK
jgi:hypothetical protein